MTERCVECGHFICTDEDRRAVPAPSPPGNARPVAAPGEVGEQLLAKAQHFDGWDGDPETAALLREAATALASAPRYGPALAQQDRRIEELESKCERLIASCERTESERDEAKRARDAAKAEAERLREALEKIVAPTHVVGCCEDMPGDWLDAVSRFKAIARAALTPAPSKDDTP
jgi:outer membrane murein-binding lipoprotein Lpp